MSYSLREAPGIDQLAELLPAFEFDCLIDRDATGAVYKASHRSLDRDVAIKVLPRGAQVDPLFRDVFQANSKAMARLTHPNLIKVYDSGELDGHLYTVMEYVHGKSLFHSARGRAIDPVQAVEIVISACRGLSHAHENGVVHGNVRPSNILLTPARKPKIGNFGLRGRGSNDAGGWTAEMRSYLAPELPDDSACGSPQADVFALGVILRELLTGIPAGSRDAAEPVVSDPGLDAICRNATHPDPAMRYPDAGSLADQLDGWLTAKESAPANTPRPLVLHAPASPVRRPMLACPAPSPAGPRPTPVSFAKPRPRGSGLFVKSCLTIALLLGAGFVARGVLLPESKPANQGDTSRAVLATGQAAGAGSSSKLRQPMTGRAPAADSGDVRETPFMPLARSEAPLQAVSSR